MNFKIDFNIPKFEVQIKHTDKIMLIGSCFTENMCTKLAERKFATYQNAHGIIFNPVSVWSSVRDVMSLQEYTTDHLFYLHEQWHSWHHHSKFSGNTKEEALQKMNTSIKEAYSFLKNANWLFITFGSAFAYRNLEMDMHVSNNHRAPAQWFEKELLSIPFMQANLQNMLQQLKAFNSNLQIVLTISPVRHLRDGVIENNKSKARLLEVVHALVAENSNTHYFPSYEIVIDELRDYRFYDIDFAHPNFLATNYVWDKLKEVAIEEAAHEIMDQMHKINLALKHKSSNPSSKAHQAFLQQNIALCQQLQSTYNYLNLTPEINYLSTELVP